ncbi:hypothetical protein SAMN04244574_04749 [Azotobacter beijerinckii]|uniref:Uncharacterized protein n=1 Tax=Azotobacter beijerinckii TaxID=170623 RepID=A0A1I4J389_9GAMM|nr:hypothetical protein SAMN04244574_04749 [Azotobacter beijerinckii]
MRGVRFMRLPWDTSCKSSAFNQPLGCVFGLWTMLLTPSADRHAASVSQPLRRWSPGFHGHARLHGYPAKRAVGSSNLQAKGRIAPSNWQARQRRQSARPAGVTGHTLSPISPTHWKATSPEEASPCAPQKENRHAYTRKTARHGREPSRHRLRPWAYPPWGRACWWPPVPVCWPNRRPRWASAPLAARRASPRNGF